jgi:glycosyltransferase involved in cell wall biosynthesis
MKVLVVHNDYRAATPSGENVAVRAQVESLRAAGVDVITYLRSSDEIAARTGLERAALPIEPLLGPGATRDLRTLLDAETPDIVHLHNVFPLISPRVIDAAHDRGVGVVATAHNYRLVCAKGTYFRDGHDCHDCAGLPIGIPAVLHACYRDSRAQSSVMVTALAAHRRRFCRVDGYVALTPLMADHLVSYGIDRERITVVPNFAPDPGLVPAPGHGALFAGRLSPEKGFRLLAAAWDGLPEGAVGPLVIAGDGRDRPDVLALARRRSDVRYAGAVPAASMPGLIGAAAVIVVPSVWDDVCPMIAVEAMALGRPVLATARGGLPYLVGTDGGEVVEATSGALRAGLRRLLDAGPAAGRAARARYERLFSPAVITSALIGVYERVLARR